MDCTYQLWITVDRPLRVQVGRLGLFSFPPGEYVYTGSARRNLSARLARHHSANKHLRWHIDYLLAAPGVGIQGTRTFEASECTVNRGTWGEILIRRFGATDCRSGCGSHLKYLGGPDRHGMTARLPDEGDGLRLVAADAGDAERLAEMALDIWHRHYFPDMLSRPEIEYLWERTYRPDALREQMRSGSVFRWIDHAGAKVGFLSYRLDSESSRLWLSKLYLLPEYHGRGIGAYALFQIKRTAAELGAREIRLYVFKKNDRAIRAYRRAGFEIAYEDYTDAGNGFFYDDYVMSLTLAD